MPLKRLRKNINESIFNKIKRTSAKTFDLEVDAIATDISSSIANFIYKRCKEHPKLLKFDKKKNRNVYVRDPKTNEPLIDENVTVYKLYYNLYPYIGQLLGMIIESSYSYDNRFDDYMDKMYVKYKNGKLSVQISKGEWFNYYGRVWKKASEIKVPDEFVEIFEKMEKFNEFTDSKLVPIYAKLFGGIFMNYGDTISKKKEYKENPTNLNLANINREILPKDFDTTKANLKLIRCINESKNQFKFSLDESLVNKIKKVNSNSFKKDLDKKFGNLFKICADLIIEKGEVEMDFGDGEIEMDLYINQNLYIKKICDIGNINNFYLQKMNCIGPYKLRLYLENNIPQAIQCFMIPLVSELKKYGWGDDDWGENSDTDFEKDLSKQEQILIIKAILND